MNNVNEETAIYYKILPELSLLFKSQPLRNDIFYLLRLKIVL